jgi:hypothetical protein
MQCGLEPPYQPSSGDRRCAVRLLPFGGMDFFSQDRQLDDSPSQSLIDRLFFCSNLCSQYSHRESYCFCTVRIPCATHSQTTFISFCGGCRRSRGRANFSCKQMIGLGALRKLICFYLIVLEQSSSTVSSSWILGTRIRRRKTTI